MSASAFDIAASGMAAHRAEMDLIAENIANAGIPRDGSTFRPRAPVLEPAGEGSFASALDSALGSYPTGSLAFDDTYGVDDGDSAFGFALFGGGVPEPVRVASIVSKPAGGDDSIDQMVSLVAAGRAYDADVAALQAAKQMDVEAIDVDRA
ncbi:MAG TPA: flagellar basal body protein [Candidatus Eremiobacteraceae bacterium]|nr:flagellar basal body protein [Candidatus Eremiobacteraceae bacterium]